MTDDRKAIIWRMWQQGYPMSEIARDIEKPAATIYSYLLYHGGITPRKRQRRATYLTLEEREDISSALAKECSIRSIARELNRSPSTISREISRNGGVVKYRASIAEQAFLKRAKRPKSFLLAERPALRCLVEERLASNWSPEQIAGWLKTRQTDTSKEMYVSHETIYKSLFIQTRALFREELKKHLRTKRMFRHAKNHKAGSRGQILDAISIRDRPAEIEDRAIPGHWEGDLIIGANNSAIATVVERQSRFTVLCKCEGRTAPSVVHSLTEQMKKLPYQICKSLTWDRGQELSAHKQFTIATDMEVYFCDPRSPWQRGTNENTNGLLRQYFPKGSGLAKYSQHELDDIAAELNARPRKTLGFRTPAEIFNNALQ
ncbi:IS30 family transposase [Herbaspirillum sp. RTI4]|nr:IS30 family transposase [Herbaspirillum sp. RTI4]MDY7578362.1 IS30 family transposase [Herbaspirillum sp. RTI4]